jgi:pyridoxamine 5'-phosphate oxidase
MALLASWMDAARGVEPEPEAMALATVDAAGRPAVRMVLARGIDERGVTFYTNRTSAKGVALLATKWAAATIFHQRLGHQVRLVGRAVRTSDEESDAYFASRPRGHQLGAWASAQSQPTPDRSAFLAAVDAAAARFEHGAVPRPPHWGGFRIEPIEVEFWQQRDDRLHDRAKATRTEGGWTVERLQP